MSRGAFLQALTAANIHDSSFTAEDMVRYQKAVEWAIRCSHRLFIWFYQMTF